MAMLGDAGIDEPVEIRWRAFQLDPGAPAGPGAPVSEVYARKFGGPDRAREILGHLTRVAAEEGIAFDMDRAVRANTMAAHRVLARAWHDGGAALQGAVKESLLSAYFVEGLDIGDEEVLANRAAAAGMDVADLSGWLADGGGLDEVRADLAEAADNDIHSVPTFVIAGGFPIPGAQDPELFVRAISRVVAGR